jgi:hypothetical protein
MPIKIFICQDPPRRDGKPAARHLQVKGLTTTDNYAIAKVIEKLNHLYSVGTGVAVLTELKRVFAELLADGHSITLDGIGTFTPKVTGKIKVAVVGKRSRVDAPQVNGIDFQPAPTLLHDINCRAKFDHILEPRPAVSDEELRDTITTHFTTNAFITTGTLSHLLNISRDLARKYLNLLVADGTLRPEGVRATKRFVLVKP